MNLQKFKQTLSYARLLKWATNETSEIIQIFDSDIELANEVWINENYSNEDFVLSQLIFHNYIQK